MVLKWKSVTGILLHGHDIGNGNYGLKSDTLVPGDLPDRRLNKARPGLPGFRMSFHYTSQQTKTFFFLVWTGMSILSDCRSSDV